MHVYNARTARSHLSASPLPHTLLALQFRAVSKLLMFSDPVSFSGDTRFEVISVLANCGRDTDRARQALVTWIRRKQVKGRTTEHILTKLRDIESKFIKDTTLHCAFRDARAETYLPRSPGLPLPSFIKAKSEVQISESVPSISTPYSTGGGTVSSSSVELPVHWAQSMSPPTSTWRLPRDLQMSEASPNLSRQSVPRIPPSLSPRIQIPCDRSLQPPFSSPMTSSSEDSELHFRQYHAPPAVGHSPFLPGHPESPLSPTALGDQNLAPPRRMSQGLIFPPNSIRIPIPRPYSQRSNPNSVFTTSSEGSDVLPGRYRSMSQPTGHMSPCRRRLTPPSSSPPVSTLPPIPADDQCVDISLSAEPSTPARSSISYTSSPERPLPIQPVPSPIPSVNESDPSDTIDGYSIQQSWLGSVADLPSDVVVRQDSPLYVCRDELDSIRRSSVHVGQPAPDVPTIGDVLESVVNECGGSPEVRQVVSKCIEFDRGYEPPYWQNRLQACGLDAEAAKHLVDEMCKQVNWGASCRRAIYV